MDEKHKLALAALKQNGWLVTSSAQPWNIPTTVRARYHWVPEPIWNFLRETDQIVAPDEKSWFLTGRDYCGESDSAYVWDEWERQSLDAASGDDEWCREIRSFWDNHFPLAFSVRSGYAHFSLARKGLVVVSGQEPEFEEVSKIASSFEDFLSIVIRESGSIGGL